MKILCAFLLLSHTVLAAPLFTREYPLWVSDAVRSLRERGLISAGAVTDHALQRGELSAVLERYLELQQREQQDFADRGDVEELRRLLDSLLQGTHDLERRTDAVETIEERLER